MTNSVETRSLEVSNPNFSIVLPGKCNAKCAFCFWDAKKKPESKQEYLKKLSSILRKLPEQFYQISITGGEPTLSPYYEDVLNLIDKEKFTKVVLSTNGANVNKLLCESSMAKIDHVNISRHAVLDSNNEKIFKTKSVLKASDIAPLSEKLNYHGVDVTLSAVLAEGFSETGSVRVDRNVMSYIFFAKSLGASAVTFRKAQDENSDLSPSKAEELFKDSKAIAESSCPVCRSKTQLIQGMKVIWRSSLLEPSEHVNGIYELVFQADGTLTEDWRGQREVNVLQSGRIVGPSLFKSEKEEIVFLKHQIKALQALRASRSLPKMSERKGRSCSVLASGCVR